MSTADEWANGYARQARADFQTWKQLAMAGAIPECHKLLFLQMACEKLSKAHLCQSGSRPDDLQARHAYIAKTLPIIIRHQMSRLGSSAKKQASVLTHTRHLAQEIELLAPAIKRGGKRPDNCEYPWEDSSGQLHIPVDWTFAPSYLLTQPAGRTFLKLFSEAIEQLQ